MKAKLGYLCSSESWGGLEMNHLRNALWMKRKGHDVVIICLKNTSIENSANEFELPVLTIPKHKKYYDFKNGKNLVTIISKHNISHNTYSINIRHEYYGICKKTTWCKFAHFLFHGNAAGIKKNKHFPHIALQIHRPLVLSA
jgi:hypothetical protein